MPVIKRSGGDTSVQEFQPRKKLEMAWKQADLVVRGKSRRPTCPGV